MIGPAGGASLQRIVVTFLCSQSPDFCPLNLGAILSVAAPPGRADARPCAAALTLASMPLIPGGSTTLKTNQHAGKTLSRFLSSGFCLRSSVPALKTNQRAGKRYRVFCPPASVFGLLYQHSKLINTLVKRCRVFCSVTSYCRLLY